MSNLNEITELLREVVTILRPKPKDHGFWHNEAAHAFRDVLPRIDAHLAGQPAPTDPTPDRRTDDDIRALWRAAGGDFHGPIVEHGTIKEADLLPFLRRLTAGQPALLSASFKPSKEWCAAVADTEHGTVVSAGHNPLIEGPLAAETVRTPTRAEMRSVEDGLRRQLAQRRVRRAAP